MFDRIKNFQGSLNWLFTEYRKFLPVVSFVGGFTWDSVTLTRIDRLSDNLILLGYIVLLGISIIVVNLVENRQIRRPNIYRWREWYPLAIQFFLGGLFSSYVVFYFKSASVTKTWIFLGILIILLFANEFLEKRLTNIYLQFTLYFLVIFSFIIFFLPVLLKVMNLFIFLLSGILSILLVAGYVYFVQKRWQFLSRPQLNRVAGMILGLYLLINIFYFFNWIPPVPLALKFSGIYHYIEKNGDSYKLHFEKPVWYQFWKKSDTVFHYDEGDSVYCFAAIFAPVDLNKAVRHRWQKYDPSKKSWIQTDRLGYQLVGGREGGYRGYTYKKNISPGRWRIDVETDDHLIIGRINFKIAVADSSEERYKIIDY